MTLQRDYVDDLGSVNVRTVPRKGPDTWDEVTKVQEELAEGGPLKGTSNQADLVHDSILKEALVKATNAFDTLTNPAGTGSLDFIKIIAPDTRYYSKITRILSEYIEHIESMIEARG